jgi:hypothetical protein
MSDITVADVLTGAQSALGDASGEITQEIIDDFQTSYGEMMDLSIKLQLPVIQREVYFSLSANTGALFPSALGVTDFDEPYKIWERGSVSSVAITSTTDGTPQTVTTAAPHGLNTSSRAELNGVQGVPGWINRDWLITVTSPTAFTLNGSIVCGSNGTGGTVMSSADSFIPMLPQQSIPSGPVGQTLGFWCWQDNILWFQGSSEVRQLWIQYYAGEDPPPSGVIGFANGRELNFLKTATAAHFSPKRQLPMGPQLRMDAYGESGVADGGGGFLRALIVPMLKAKQGIPVRPQRYRPRRIDYPLMNGYSYVS